MLKTVFLGSRPFVFPLIETLATHSHLVGIVTKPDAAIGRGQEVVPSPVKAYRASHCPSVPIFTLEKLTQEAYDALKDLNADVFVVAAYGLLIPQRFLDLPTRMTINIHPSLLPHLRGASPLQSALLEGLDETGVTIMKLDAELDHGPLIRQEVLPIDPQDTFETLGEKAFRKASAMLPDILDSLEKHTETLTTQDEQKVTFCKQITREEGYIDPQNPPEKKHIDRMIRAYYPWPGVWTKVMIKGQELRLKLFPNQEVQLEGKKRMSVKEFLNGYPELTDQLALFF